MRSPYFGNYMVIITVIKKRQIFLGNYKKAAGCLVGHITQKKHEN